MTATLDWVSSAPSSPLRGEVSVPGDKSVSHRAVILAAVANGTSTIEGFLEGEDTRATVRIFEAMGVEVSMPSATRRIVRGVGLHGLEPPAEVLDCGNSGTAMRILAGMLAGQSFDTTLVGDTSLSRRPMRRVTLPLTRMGARIETGAEGTPPLQIRGGADLRGTKFSPPVASAQVKSALLLAGLYAHGRTVVREPRPTRDYTERMLAACGWPVDFKPGWAALDGGHALHAFEIAVPGDFSSAAFFLVAATLVPGSELLLRNVGMNPRRTGLLRVLTAMGADVTVKNVRDAGAEPVADLAVRYAPLHGIEVSSGEVADMIDEFPALFVAAACAEGTTIIRGAAELRVKESDRIAVMAEGLRSLGARIEEAPDGAVIEGGSLTGGEVAAHGDHRCAMAFAVGGNLACAEVMIRDCANVATSFPGFAELARDCGMVVRAA